MTNNDNKVEIILNEYIFNSISQYLIEGDINFSSVLEYSLLSKHWFRVFQNLIISQNCKLILSFDSFLKYIINYNNNNNNNTNDNNNNVHNSNSIIASFINKIKNFNINDNNNNNSNNISKIEESYKYKLIQFKDIENIIVKNINNSKSIIKEMKKGKKLYNKPSNIHPGSYDITDTVKYIDPSIIFQKNISISKEFLEINCPNIKKVTVLEHQSARNEYDFDYWCNGLFNFKSLQLYYTCETYLDYGDDDDI